MNSINNLNNNEYNTCIMKRLLLIVLLNCSQDASGSPGGDVGEVAKQQQSALSAATTTHHMNKSNLSRKTSNYEISHITPLSYTRVISYRYYLTFISVALLKTTKKAYLVEV